MKGLYKYLIFIFIYLFYIFQVNISFGNVGGSVNLAQNSLQSASNSNWISTSAPIKISSTRFNWVKRNDTKKKVYYSYNNLIIILESLQNVSDLFRNKLKEVEKINLDFKSGLSRYASSFDKNFNDIDEMYNKINDNISFLKKLEESELFKEKEFKKEVAKINDELENQNLIHKNNIDNIDLVNQSIKNLYDSINVLENQIKIVKSFEDNAWKEYQKLDELISDDQAKAIYFKILNFSENAEQINIFIRGNFLNFFNKTMQNVVSAINTINDDIENWIKQSNLIIKKVDDLVKRDINEKIKIKQKEDEINNQKIMEEKKKELDRLKKSIKPKTFTEEVFDKILIFKNNTLIIFTNFISKIKNIYFEAYQMIFNKKYQKNQISIKNLYEKKESDKNKNNFILQKNKDSQLEVNKIEANAGDILQQTQQANYINNNLLVSDGVVINNPQVNSISSQPLLMQPPINNNLPIVTNPEVVSPLTQQAQVIFNPENNQNISNLNASNSVSQPDVGAALFTSETIPETPLVEDKKPEIETQTKEQFKQTFPEGLQAQQNSDKQESLLLSMSEASKVSAPTENVISSIGVAGNKGFLDKTDLNMEKSGNIGERAEKKSKKGKKSKKKKTSDEVGGEEKSEEKTEKVFHNKPVVRAKSNKKKTPKKSNSKNKPTRRPVLT
jgi:hypothetical protein